MEISVVLNKNKVLLTSFLILVPVVAVSSTPSIDNVVVKGNTILWDEYNTYQVTGIQYLSGY